MVTHLLTCKNTPCKATSRALLRETSLVELLRHPAVFFLEGKQSDVWTLLNKNPRSTLTTSQSSNVGTALVKQEDNFTHLFAGRLFEARRDQLWPNLPCTSKAGTGLGPRQRNPSKHQKISSALQPSGRLRNPTGKGERFSCQAHQGGAKREPWCL